MFMLQSSEKVLTVWLSAWCAVSSDRVWQTWRERYSRLPTVPWSCTPGNIHLFIVSLIHLCCQNLYKIYDVTTCSTVYFNGVLFVFAAYRVHVFFSLCFEFVLIVLQLFLKVINKPTTLFFSILHRQLQGIMWLHLFVYSLINCTISYLLMLRKKFTTKNTRKCYIVTPLPGMIRSHTNTSCMVDP